MIRLLEVVENVRLGEKERHAFQGYQNISWFCWTHEVLIKQWEDFSEKLQFVSQNMAAYVERPSTKKAGHVEAGEIVGLKKIFQSAD